MLIFTLTAFIMKIPVIHFYGGEISKGAIDNVIRNQISLMSKYHFVSNLDHKKILLNLESTKKTYLILVLSLDRLKINLFSIKSVEKIKNFFIKTNNISYISSCNFKRYNKRI